MTFASRILVPALVVCSLLASSGVARAAGCGEGGSCPPGTHCETADTGACPDCAGPNCPPCAPPRSFCLADRIACESDTDCPGYLVCMQTTIQTSCPGCPDPAPLPKKDTHTCVFKERTCTAESDCADGLACVASPYEVCSGGGGAEPTCTPVDYSLCMFRAIGCETTADCPYDFVCDNVGLACDQLDGSCGVSPTRFCRARGVVFSVTADGKQAYSEIISVSHEAQLAADGRGNTASVANAKAARDNGSASGPPATDPGCALSGPAEGKSSGAPLRVGLVGLLGLLALRARRRGLR